MTTDKQSYPDPEAPGAHTSIICENLALFGGAPQRDELDSRVTWDEHDSLWALQESIRIIVEGITVEGTQMADEREPLMWGFVNMMHAQMQRLDRTIDRIIPDMRDLQAAQDGSEVKASELELLTDRAQNLGDRRDAFEKMRDLAADAYRAETGNMWRPRHGSHVSQTGTTTQAWIDARDYQRARKEREIEAHLPDGIWKALDRVLAKHPDMVLVHGGGPGVDKIAASWAEARGVKQVVCRPNWKAYENAAPFRRNDDIINLMPKGIVAFPGSGITANLVDKARQAGIPVMEMAA